MLFSLQYEPWLWQIDQLGIISLIPLFLLNPSSNLDENFLFEVAVK